MDFPLIGFTASCDQKRAEAATITQKTDISEDSSEIHYLISSSGDTIPTGVPIPAKGKWIDPDSVEKPKTIPLQGKSKVVTA